MTSNELPHPRRFALACAMASALLFSACGSVTTSNTSSGDTTVASLPEPTADVTTDDDASSSEGAGEGTVNDGEAEPTEDLSPEEAELRFEQCLEDAGIDNPFDNVEGESITGEDSDDDTSGMAFELGEDVDFEAFEKCNEILSDAFGEFTPSPEQEALIKDAELEFNQCMTDKGFDIDGASGGFEISGDIDISEIEEAASECDSAFDALNSAFAEEGDDS